MRNLSMSILILLFIPFFAQAQVSIPNTLSDEEKLYGLSKFWQEVNYNFAFFDQVPHLDWDSAYRAFIPQVLATGNDYEYYRTLQRFCALLHDGHTNVYMPQRIDSLLSSDSFGKYRFTLTEIDHKAIVTRTAPGTMDEIPLGSEVIEVNGMPTEAYLREHVFPYISTSTEYILWDAGIYQMLRGFKGEQILIRIRRPDGMVKTFELTRENSPEEPAPAFEKKELLDFRWLENEVAYLALNSFGDPKIDTLFEEKLPELRKAKAMIIDLRNNGGGNTDIGTAILRHLTNDSLLYGSKSLTRKHIAAYKAWGFYTTAKDTVDNLWAKRSFNYYHDQVWHEFPYGPEKNTVKTERIIVPTVVLFGHHTASAAEDFLIYAERMPHFLYLGERSYGSTGQPLTFQLPGDCWARVCTKKDIYPDGREFVGYGIEPDVYVDKTLEDYLANQDPVLEKAQVALQSEEMMNKGKIRAEKISKASVEDPEVQRIRGLIAQFSKDLVAGDYDAVVAAYTDDASIFPGNTPILKGEQAIRNYWTPPADRKSKTVHHQITPVEIQIVEDTAYDWGYYEGKTRMENGDISDWKGKYVIIWKKDDAGDWKIFLDIWNRVQ